jgi:ribonuclease HI
MSGPFTCARCGRAFDVPPAVLERYPGWTPRTCMTCRDVGGAPRRPDAEARVQSAPTARSSAGVRLLPHEVLRRFTAGPKDGVFTDGSATPNPGPGGWAAVRVAHDAVIEERHGRAADTTNNRMELTALIEAYRMVPAGEATTIHSDSELAVKTVNEWAPGWARAGWKRKSGAIANLDLVRELTSLAQARPDVRLVWVPAHSGWRWNEYADALAAEYLRDAAPDGSGSG